MIIDKKGKLFGKINVVDIAVVLIIVVAVAVTYFKFNMSEHSDVTEYKTSVTYTINARNLRNFTTDAVDVGEILYDKASDKPAGKIIDKKVSPSKEYITCADGSIVKADLPDRYDLELVVESPALIRNGMVIIECGSVHLNRTASYYTRRILTDFETTDIKVNQ